MDRCIYLNGSGIKDPTAYKAITEVDNMQFERGEIYEVMNYKDEDAKYALVVSADFRKNDRIISVIMLSNDRKGKDDIVVNCNGIKYAPPTGVQYIFSDRLFNFLRRATKQEMDEVDHQIARYLGLNVCNGDANEAVNEIPASESHTYNPVNPDELIEAMTESRIYKELCEKLIGLIQSRKEDYGTRDIQEKNR